jgi:hypothetical protein
MIVSTIPFSYPEFPNKASSVPSIGSGNGFDLNAALASVAYVMQMPSTQTINRVFFRVASVTTGCNAKVALEEVSLTDGLPTGVPIHSSATTTQLIANTAQDYEVTFPGSFSIPQGKLFAFVIQALATPTTPVSVRFALFQDDNSASGLPYSLDSGVFGGIAAPCLGLGLSSGGAFPMRFMWPINEATGELFNSTSTPDFRGNKITLSAKLRCIGLRLWVDLDAAAIAILYDSDGVTELGSVNLYANIPPDGSSWVQDHFFNSSVVLNPGTYYVAVKATSSAFNIALGVVTFPSSAWRSGSPFGGADVEYVGATDNPAAGWTPSDNKQAFISLLIDGIDDGAGAGGGGGETSHIFIG